jgi:LPS-assembly protein
LPAPGSFAQRITPTKPSISAEPAPPATASAEPVQPAAAPIEAAPTVTSKTAPAPQPTPRPQEPVAAVVTAPREPAPTSTPAPAPQTLASEPATPPRFAGNLRPADDAASKKASFPANSYADLVNPMCKVLAVRQPRIRSTYSTDADSEPLDVLADEAESLSSDIYNYSGAVSAAQTNQELRSDFLSINNEKNIIEAWGNAELIEPGQHAVGTHGTVYRNENKSELFNASYRLTEKHANGDAEKVVKEGRYLTTYYNANYTTCDPDNKVWRLDSSKVIIDKESGWGESYNNTLRILDIPVFYSPYYSFPIDDRRKSGFLSISSASSSIDGASLIIPWYWNIEPEQHAVITTRLIEKRGAALKIEHEHLKKENQGTASLEFLPSDSLYGKSRYAFSIKNSGTINDYKYKESDEISYSADLNAYSDRDYKTDLQTDFGINSDTHLTQTASMTYTGSIAPITDQYAAGPTQGDAFGRSNHEYNLSVSASSWYKIDESVADSDDPYTVLPNISASWASTTPYSLNSLSTGLSGSVARYTHDTNIDGLRYNIAPSIGYTQNLLGGAISVTPSYSVNHIRYDLLEGSKSTLTRTVPTYSLAGAINLERFFKTESTVDEKKTILDISNWHQTLTPSISYTYIPKGLDSALSDELDSFITTETDENERDLYSRTFIGGDKVSHSNQISFKVESILSDDDDSNEVAKASLNQVLDLSGQSDEAWSNIAADLQLNILPAGNISSNISASTNINPHKKKLDGASLEYSYSDIASQNLFQADYSFSGENKSSEYLGISGTFRLTPNWNIFGSYKYDLAGTEKEPHLLQSLVGLEYDSCCWTTRFAFNKKMQEFKENNYIYENVFFIIFEMKGLGAIGQGSSKIESIKSANIGGYSESLYINRPYAKY